MLQVIIGNIVLSSSKESVERLISLALGILDHDLGRAYLESVRNSRKRITGLDYFG